MQSYVRGGLKSIQYKRTGFQTPQVIVTTLPPSADSLLLETAQARQYYSGDDDGQWATPDDAAPEAIKARAARAANRAALLKAFQAAAPRFPGDRLAQVGLARAEVSIGDRATGERLLTVWLAAQPNDVEALQLMARAKMTDGDNDNAKRTDLYREAGALLARAYTLNPGAYQSVIAYVRTRWVEPDYPSENSITALLEAHALAPQVSETTLMAAQALMTRGRYREAGTLLKPLANDPHGGALAATARGLLRLATERAG